MTPPESAVAEVLVAFFYITGEKINTHAKSNINAYILPLEIVLLMTTGMKITKQTCNEQLIKSVQSEYT